MTCQNCARQVQNALTQVPGVARAEINLETETARILWIAEPGPTSALLHAVKQAGYAAKETDKTTPDATNVWNRPLYLGLPATAALILAEWVFRLDTQPWYGWAAFALALPVQIFVGGPFYTAAWRQIQQGRLTMDTLVSLGSTAAFGLSLYGLLRPGTLAQLHFMEAAAILSLVGLGHWLETRIARRANTALRALLHLAPQWAHRLRPDATEEEIPVTELKPGDLILLKPGDRVPVDGTLANDHSIFDESMLTGEAEPVPKGPGDAIYAGTLNVNRRVVFRATAVGAETALAHIVAVVQRAQQSRAAIESLVDRISRLFVAAVLLAAALTLGGWVLAGADWEHAIIIAVSVVIVACPCAMGLATPAALLAAGNVSARRGILFRDAAALEKCGQITAVLFDKTGTLTASEPTVIAVEPRGMPEEEFAALVRALTVRSNHPASQSLAAHYSQAAQIALDDWREERGSGVSALYQGRTARLGSTAWLAENGILLPPCDLTEKTGLTPLGLTLGTDFHGTLFLDTNRAKPEAAQVIQKLRAHGLHVYLISGDIPAAAQALAGKIGIEETRVFARIRPEEKAGIVAALQKKGEKVAFVGDGINDAPALAQADLGIAVLGASDVASESADVLFLKRNLDAVPEIIALSAATLRTIHQNLFWAFFYNALAIPLTMAGLMPPLISALAMGLSDIFVMGNAFRLSRWKPGKA